MLRRICTHLGHNVIGYVALFAALGGTSYAAVNLHAGSVTSRTIAPAAVTHSKLGRSSVTSGNIRNGTITQADLARTTIAAVAKGTIGSSGASGKAGANGTSGSRGGSGTTGPAGPAGPTGPAGANGNSAIIARSRAAGAVTGPHGASTNVPLSGASWSQGPTDMDLITGSVTVTIPGSCTGSFGNALLLSVDGTPATFASLPTAPASSTVTVPIVVTSSMESGSSVTHQLSASIGNSCTKDGEDYRVSDVKVDVVKFS